MHQTLRRGSGHLLGHTLTPGEVLASSTVKDLVVGSGIDFDDRGARTLKDIAGEWRLYAARDTS